ncbi:Homocysteine-responsive endoplasmic reticulum-resident ubiquitin-like domain member 2 protein [Liparis tanakae]|uniref:Homocysteine-responsive endoplasmic reticulum-resident ubiquitin-like domain member 2 protein n=1 Tax=Liparis tanakae TaxID=230148 RepID=A0A4Z2EJH3_9TELE|nr:Homocysteine-responsive endoplasmic reticulum-resident ubiquitin-like domain member 2 protein [Liparis tanakae]
MDSWAVDSPVTLIIKAPNQKYEDHTISCFLNWTVERLKSHISNVYPSKPLSKDQRLVYSGKLLQDHLQLGDVLRKVRLGLTRWPMFCVENIQIGNSPK